MQTDNRILLEATKLIEETRTSLDTMFDSIDEISSVKLPNEEHSYYADVIGKLRTQEHNLFLLGSREILLNNDIFNLLDECTLKSKKHKALLFGAYALIKGYSIFGTPLTSTRIKTAWGFNPDSQSLDYLLKENGELDKIGITETVTMQLDEFDKRHHGYNVSRIKSKRLIYDVDFNVGRFFKVPLQAMLYCMCFPDQLGVEAFFIYCFICYLHQCNSNQFKEISLSYFMRKLSMSKGTVIKYLNNLESLGLITKIEGKRTAYDRNEMNKYKPNLACNLESLLLL